MNRLSNFPHPLALFTIYDSRHLAERISQHMTIPLGSLKDKPFPDGESFIQIQENIRGKDVFIVGSICRSEWRYEYEGRCHTGLNDNLMELLIFCDAAARASAWRITAVIPYFGYARQDRKTDSRTPISARVVASMLEGVGANRILTMDLHTEQIQGFFSSSCILDHLNAGQIFSDFFKKENLGNAVIVSPDVGNLKKADKYRQGMPSSLDLAVIDKRRNQDGTVISKRLIGDVKDKTVILFDDIISTGGTMISAMEFCDTHGAKDFYVAATHGVFADHAIKTLDNPRIKKIIVTDTLPLLFNNSTRQSKIQILSVGDLFGEAISRIHQNQSISELLGIFS